MQFRNSVRNFAVFAAMTVFTAPDIRADDEFEHPPINYSRSAPKNCISQLQNQIDGGAKKLDYDEKFGYLPALLKTLNVPKESQMLVFSKTSFQLRYITPRTPRAVYFNDSVYIGYCQSGEVLEISAVDPQLGAVFYSLEQEKADKPQFTRRIDNCLTCHSSSRTESVPGHLVRSLFVDTSGQPLLSGGSHSVDHTTPLENRWGGWYVTGQHGGQKHMGNMVIQGRNVPREPDNAKGLNITQLNNRIDVKKYLSPHSDIAALMVLEHQTLVHNHLTKANFTARQAVDYQVMMNQMAGDPLDKPLESTARRIQSAGDDLVDVLLFVGEAKLTEPVTGTSGFAETFARTGPRDPLGRSLRDIDLTTRLFKYPCSYLIHSDSFRELPQPMKNYVWQRLWKILNGEDANEKYAHITQADKTALVEILRATTNDLPGYWKAKPGATAAKVKSE